jgi:hypothetical protein
MPTKPRVEKELKQELCEYVFSRCVQFKIIYDDISRAANHTAKITEW